MNCTNKSVLVFLPATDFNETEFIAVRDMCKKHELIMSVTSDAVGVCRGKNLQVKPDVPLYNIHAQNFAVLVLIGGRGVTAYKENKLVQKCIAQFYAAKKIIAAICIAPVLFAKAGMAARTKITAHPDAVKELKSAGFVVSDNDVMTDGNIITARDQNASALFAELIKIAIERG